MALKIRKSNEKIVMLNEMNMILAEQTNFYVTVEGPVTVEQLAEINKVAQSFEMWLMSAKEESCTK